MRIRAFRSLRPRFLGGLLLSLLLTFPVAVHAAAGTEATAPDCARTGLNSQPVAGQLTRIGELVQATLHSPSSDLPAAGCTVPLRFQISEDARPPRAVWRDVEGRAVRIDGTPDPAHPDPLPLRLWIRPDGTLDYEVREAGVNAAHAALTLAVAWGTTAAANDLAVLDILGAALELELDFFDPVPVLDLRELGVQLDDTGRVTELDWYDNHPYETTEHYHTGLWKTAPKRGIHPPDVRVTWQLPSELGQLTALSRLALGGPLLTGTIPPELGQLANLEQLTLAGSRLTGAVPPELDQLTQLRELELHGNRLTALPPELGRLFRLTHLGLAGNRLTTLPPELGRLRRLEFLDVQDNQLTSLPPLAGFDQLYYLDLSDNRLTSLPTGLAQLVHLKELDMSDNRIAALPPGSFTRPFRLPSGATSPLQQKILQMARQRGALTVTPLTRLDLSGNRLTSLPSELGRLRPNLLDLSDNRLTSLPPELGQLQPPAHPWFTDYVNRTVTLDLSGNQLTDLPPELGRISNLVQLDLSDNQLTDLPDVLFQLDQLEALNLSGNPLGTLPPEIGKLSALEILGLSSNRLTALPPELGELWQLVSLDLSGNRLTALPSELKQASHLRHLNLSSNRLTALPPELGELWQL
ncbi:MAG: leucine-rich repeat domain-containing protein, partial [Caldilineaceae bacterium]|nr:leucine-rich repeat domain-containing protein [Caldilineaceae bacterium]